MAAAPDAVHTAIDYTLREDRGRLMAALVGAIGDFELADECLQEAAMAAMEHWCRNGVPNSRRGWLLQVARRRAIDHFRRQTVLRKRQAELVLLAEESQGATEIGEPDIPDKRLELIFTCCHPALDPKSRVALTLRTLGGLDTAQVAAAFLDRETTMGQRLSRARAKISRAGIPFEVPGPELWDERLASVLAVIYLIFNAGHVAGAGGALMRRELCEEAIYLARMLDRLRPDEPEVLGVLSLMLTSFARAPARLGAGGEMIPLDEQDRSLWRKDLICEGVAALDSAVSRGRGGPYQIKAAISALHASARRSDETDWTQIVLLYNTLLQHEPTPVVRLNRAVAVACSGRLTMALEELDALAQELDGYQPFHAAHARLLADAGAVAAARRAYDRAIELARNAPDRAFLEKQKRRLPP